jgi:hypothetical protein
MVPNVSQELAAFVFTVKVGIPYTEEKLIVVYLTVLSHNFSLERV